jgi:hypothetical protein
MPSSSDPTGNPKITAVTEGETRRPVASAAFQAVVVAAPRYVDPTTEGERIVLPASGITPPSHVAIERHDPAHTRHAGEFDRMEALAAKLVQIPKSEVDEKRKDS